MKRILVFLICFSLVLSIFGMNLSVCKAIAPSEVDVSNELLITESIEYLPNGNSVSITISEAPVITYASTYNKSATKTYTFRNSDGEILWQFSIRGTFAVTTGVSAVCTAVTHSYSITNTNWHYDSGSSYYTGNKAIGKGEFNLKMLFVTIESHECEVILTCDVNGNLT